MRRIVTALLALAVLLGLAIATPMMASADTGQSCAQELNLQRPSSTDAAAKTPVILVHGLWGNKNSLKPIGDSLASLEGVVSYAFDYKSANNRWVTEGGTDQRLARTIVCYSKLYGGKKVIIVAHSMGGLLTRAALDWAAYGTFAKKVVGHIVTIGTPHTGADIAYLTNMLHDVPCELGRFWYGEDAYRACQQLAGLWATSAMHPGSSELAALPRFPGGITVRAIAGDVTTPSALCVAWSCPLVDHKSDLVVQVSSATDEYTSTGVGDGKKVYSCTGSSDIEPISLAWCSHGGLTKAPEVQADVKASIQAYLASLKPKRLPLPPHMMYDFFTRFKLPFLKTWDTGMSEPNAVLNVVDRSVCTADNASCPHIYFIDLTSSYGKKTYGNDPVGAVARESCTTAGQGLGSVGSGRSVTVGGVAARYYPEIKCANGQGYGQAIWYVPSKKLMVTSPFADAGPSFDYDGLRAVLDNIEWVS